MKQKILVVDDEPSLRRMLHKVLTAMEYRVDLAVNGDEAVRAVRAEFYDLVLMDLRMPGIGGLEALDRVRRINPLIPVVIMTAYASVDTAITALKAGAFDYLTKPLDLDELKILIERTLRHQSLETENRQLKAQLGDRFNFTNIIGRSPGMAALFKTMAQVAPTEATILITGESGTGKELIADALHRNSPRADQPMVKVNCAALPENLLESELFGHEKGAFTGAVSKRQGRFQLAHKSSLFLDEIGEMAPAIQAKILRALQEGEVEPLGGGATVRVDVRVIAATNKILEEEIAENRFREDLYYRLNVVKLEIPPLRDRREDILLLADFFLKRYGEKNRKLIKGFAPRAMNALMRYDWPGNIRELENLVERAVILTRGDMISTDDFPETLAELISDEDPEERAVLTSGRSLKEMEKEMILRTLEEVGGNRTRASKILGISRRTLQLKLKEYGIN